MFTGIVQDCLPVATLEQKVGLTTLSFQFTPTLLDGLQIGASVALNGTCCTVTRIEGDRVSFDAIAETLRLTNLSDLVAGSPVNIERSAKVGDEIGGHLMSGHIVGTAQVKSVDESENNRRIMFSLDPAWCPYVFHKGFLALNGASLTVATIDKAQAEMSVTLIPETLRVTNFALLQPGDRVNVELDQQTQAIVDTVTRVLAEQQAGIDAESKLLVG